MMGLIGPTLGLARGLGLPVPPRSGRLDVDGKVALVTGAAHGIGLAVARELHARGAQVALVDVDDAAIGYACDALGDDRALALTADVRDRAAMADVVDQTVGRFGALDIVVANAGVAPETATLRTLDPDEYDRVIAVNQTGVFNTVKPAIEPIIAARGHVVVVASVAALLPGPASSPYAASKAATEQLGRALRIELAHLGASAGVAYFGVVDTDLVHTKFDSDPLVGELDRLIPGPLKRRLSPEQAAVVIADGIEARAAHTIAPAIWRPVAVLRGLADVLGDVVAGDARAGALLRRIEERA